jgi:L-histidine N-alpha-methyltransferase
VTLVDALYRRGSVTAIAAAELDSTLAAEMLQRVASRDVHRASVAIACDCTIDLPLPDDFPRPRIYLCLGNALGGTTTVGAVRLLRILRTTMGPNDSVVLGLSVRPDSEPDGAPLDPHPAAARHLAALGLVDSTLGGPLDASQFDYRRQYDVENLRLETHLVARRAFGVELPGIGALRFRKGESIRTSVSCTFDRRRVTAMLAGVGLTLRDWTTDAHGRFVVTLATPAV